MSLYTCSDVTLDVKGARSNFKLSGKPMNGSLSPDKPRIQPFPLSPGQPGITVYAQNNITTQLHNNIHIILYS
jgi:hypothetical protein